MVRRGESAGIGRQRGLRRGLRWPVASVLLALSLVAAACGSGDSGGDVLTQCVQHETVSTHIHALVIPVFNGQPASLPANLGITQECMRPLHTHDETSVVHIESPDGRSHTLEDLFTIWGDENPYQGVPVVGISLNGQRFSGDMDQLTFEEGQRIVVEYRNN